MKTESLKYYNVSELSLYDKKEVNGGAVPVAVAVIAAGGVFAVGVVVGAVAVYGAYRLVKWMMS
jgi:hypothetical protein